MANPQETVVHLVRFYTFRHLQKSYVSSVPVTQKAWFASLIYCKRATYPSENSDSGIYITPAITAPWSMVAPTSQELLELWLRGNWSCGTHAFLGTDTKSYQKNSKRCKFTSKDARIMKSLLCCHCFSHLLAILFLVELRILMLWWQNIFGGNRHNFQELIRSRSLKFSRIRNRCLKFSWGCLCCCGAASLLLSIMQLGDGHSHWYLCNPGEKEEEQWIMFHIHNRPQNPAD